MPKHTTLGFNCTKAFFSQSATMGWLPQAYFVGDSEATNSLQKG
jgi:hypothetical protein